jgi:hypothetical protein
MIRVLFVCVVAATFVLAGCQAQQPSPDTTSMPIETLPTPSIKGPTSPPSVKGPTSPPPSSDDSQPQSMTETEKVEYTLPQATSADFKS